MQMTMEGECYHKTCFRCAHGGCTLTHSSYAALDGVLYCRHHFARLFMEKGDSRAYFLTHLHSDHTRGLSSSWKRGLLVCSRTTAKLLSLKFPRFNLSILCILDAATWHCLSLPSLTSGTDPILHVMPINACHCPCSVIYLFRGEFGRVLCTGDFRWEMTGEDARKPREALLRALDGRRVDSVYLDNTYCHPSHDFPARRTAAEKGFLPVPNQKNTEIPGSSTHTRSKKQKKVLC